jgi:hypothetical protein
MGRECTPIHANKCGGTGGVAGTTQQAASRQIIAQFRLPGLPMWAATEEQLVLELMHDKCVCPLLPPFAEAEAARVAWDAARRAYFDHCEQHGCEAEF